MGSLIEWFLMLFPRYRTLKETLGDCQASVVALEEGLSEQKKELAAKRVAYEGLLGDHAKLQEKRRNEEFIARAIRDHIYKRRPYDVPLELQDYKSELEQQYQIMDEKVSMSVLVHALHEMMKIVRIKATTEVRQGPERGGVVYRLVVPHTEMNIMIDPLAEFRR